MNKFHIALTEEKCSQCKDSPIVSQTIEGKIVRRCWAHLLTNPPQVVAPADFVSRYAPPVIIQRVDTIDPALPPRRRGW